jgi:FlaA1/EpsC-like NDP-sugar epimerase
MTSNFLDHPVIRFIVKFLLDMGLAAIAWNIASFSMKSNSVHSGLTLTIQWTMVAALMNFVFQLSRQHYRFIGRPDLLKLGFASSAIIVCNLILIQFETRNVLGTQFGIFIFAGFTTGILWLGLRLTIAEIYELRGSMELAREEGPRASNNVVIVGAGHAGLLILQELLRHPELGHKVIGFVDDASNKRSIRIHGTPVLGTSEELPELLVEHGITLAILAIPSAPGHVIRRLTQVVTEHGVKVKTVPGIFNLLGSQSWIPEIKDVAIEDLLRREPVQLDQAALSHIIEDSVVLITGGGGSIGSELARQVAAFRPARIILLGRGENSLWEAEQQLRNLFPNQALSIELCDIRNAQRLKQAFEKWRPEIVLHAAAHKHVPYLEAHPTEAVNNNVLGTLNVVRETQAIGAHTFVNISTDKAVNPANVLGATKFMAECIVLDAAAKAAPHQRFVSVRFGNVLGSRGSVIPIFKDQIRRGGPITVTHADMTRYFMTIPEASQLVLQAGILGDNGKIFVLDMGDPIKISALAEDMARLSGLTLGQDIEIRYSGIRPGEKLYEEIFLESEQQQSPVHPKVFEAIRAPNDPLHLQRGINALSAALSLPEGERQREILQWLKIMVPTYKPSPTGLGRYEKDSTDRRHSGEFSRIIAPVQ